MISVKKTFQLTTSRRGRLVTVRCTTRLYGLSTHDLTKRSTIIPDMLPDMSTLFQLTTSRRGRPQCGGLADGMDDFQLTTSRRGRPLQDYDACISRSFQLTTSRRGRRHHIFSHTSRERLSTHDLTKRSTSSDTGAREALMLSTHDLTKRSTCRLIWVLFHQTDLSTHDLTKRSTHTRSEIADCLKPFNSRPHEEVDDTTSLISKYNSSFQLTTSRRGRRSCSGRHGEPR